MELSNNQDIILKSRKKLYITGLTKIISLNESEFYLQTSLGKLIISGDNLTMTELELEKGNLEITGEIKKLEYLDSIEKEKNKKTFLGRLFK